jgi:general secretion pathway protein B
MSYILDALKKAEADADPDLRASLELNRQQHRAHSWGLYLIAAALIGNLAVLVWLFGPYSDNSVTTVAPAAEQAVRADPESATAPTSSPEPTPPTAKESVSRVVPAEPQPTPAVSEPIHTNLAGMSDAARDRFPELSFSTHVYAADPSLRAVVVNGERLTEGDRLGNLRLTNITETGVVFRFENYLVSISVLDDWD